MTHINPFRTKAALIGVFAAAVAGLSLTAAGPSLPTAKPEEVGLSSQRLTRIGDMMQRHIAAGEIAGGVTLVARRGRIAHFEAHGTMDLETKRPMQKDSVFRIASMTKVVTGVATLMMLEEGKLRITDPVSKFIPEFGNLTVAVAQPRQGPPQTNGEEPAAPSFYRVPTEREVTVRDLLTHTSGLASGPMSNSSVREVARQPGDTLADYIPRLGRTALEFQPGSRWAYSPQAGFDALGRIVEVVSGMPFDQFLRQRLFGPLGMTDVSFYATEALEPRLVTAYQLTPNGIRTNPNPNSMSSRVYFMGSGGLVTTAEEYLKFGQMLLNGGELNGARILSPRTVEQMASVHVSDTLPGRPVGEGYGLSVRVLNHAVANGSRLSDGAFGWSGAYGTHFWVDPKEEIVAILMIQTPVREMRPEFENAVMQAVID
ncbi:MAG: beta-lactamase family protein [Gemmatimonadetes bacterium]|nr:beta-lactamase family protein [Gemmatimonadota bacterium]